MSSRWLVIDCGHTVALGQGYESRCRQLGSWDEGPVLTSVASQKRYSHSALFAFLTSSPVLVFSHTCRLPCIATGLAREWLSAFGNNGGSVPQRQMLRFDKEYGLHQDC